MDQELKDELTNAIAELYRHIDAVLNLSKVNLSEHVRQEMVTHKAMLTDFIQAETLQVRLEVRTLQTRLNNMEEALNAYQFHVEREQANTQANLNGALRQLDTLKRLVKRQLNEEANA